MPNVRDHLPGVFVIVAGLAEGRHSGRTDSLFDDEIDLPVRHLLCIFRTQIRWPRIHEAVKLRLAVAAVPVACGAKFILIPSSFDEVYSAICKRILHRRISVEDGAVMNFHGDHRLHL